MIALSRRQILRLTLRNRPLMPQSFGSFLCVMIAVCSDNAALVVGEFSVAGEHERGNAQATRD